MKVAVTGGTGFVGSRLVEKLEAGGHQTVLLTRNADRARQQFPADVYKNVTIVSLTSTPWQSSLSGCDGVVNLAGEPISDARWSADRKKLLMDSRIVTTEKLVDAIAAAEVKPKVLVSASAIGFYGTSETATFDESSPAGEDFLAEICKNWEAAANVAQASGTRVVIIRLGIVLGMGGVIGKMLPPFKLFAGGPIGTGKQGFSWIHRDDAVDLLMQALTEPTMQGVYNGTAPNPVTMGELCSEMGKSLGRPSWLPVPAIALEALLGEGAKLVLEGQKVLPTRSLSTGFKFTYSFVSDALKQVLAGA
jgi:uncharacterized protein (TIGR01777 family)